MLFYLGTHHPHWLSSAGVPLFVSRRRLEGRRTLPVAIERWALDSGGFTELSTWPHRWTTTTDDYVEQAQRYGAEIGLLDWAAPMDWMCEPWIIEATGLSVREHQERTVQNFLDLRNRGPFVPVLQGWTPGDYERCIDLYAEAGVDLAAAERVGLGSVCRRQDTHEIGSIVRLVAEHGINAHGFGVKFGGIVRYGHALASADSMAWSMAARYDRPLPGHTHKTCANCQEYALRWRKRVLGGGVQLALI